MLPRVVAATEIGKKARVGIIRDGKPLVIDVIIGELPEEGLKASKKPEVEKDFGLVVQDITPEIAKHLNLKDRRGVIATDVAPGSPAGDADIRSGDIIKEISRKPIQNMADFKAAIKNVNIKEGIVMLIKRENTTFYTVVRE
jgi:serine protease Do